jgi:1-acyl-sn-glycerol-3-phosphate acyltransferase
MKRTIFNTPLITPAFRYLFRALRCGFWAGAWWDNCPIIPKFVIVGAPHTSNWDFVMFLALAFILKGNLRYMGKKELFYPPYGWFFRWCGGVPVDRSKPQGLVEQTVQAIQEADRFQLVITPEGTRSKVGEWKRVSITSRNRQTSRCDRLCGHPHQDLRHRPNLHPDR